jgi:hypothetical protein
MYLCVQTGGAWIVRNFHTSEASVGGGAPMLLSLSRISILFCVFPRESLKRCPRSAEAHLHVAGITVTDSCSAVQSPTSATIGGSVRKRSDQSIFLNGVIVCQPGGPNPMGRRCRRHCRCCDGYDCVN